MTATLGLPESGAVGYRVVEAVAEATDSDPTELEPLYHAVDPDALERLVSSSSGESGTTTGARAVRFDFTYEDHRVHVSPDGAVDVTPLDAPNDGPRPATDASAAVVDGRNDDDRR